MLLTFLLSSLPITPFSAPSEIFIPEGLPSQTVPSQVFKKVNWLNTSPQDYKDFRVDKYVGLTRRRGNIVSLYVLKRTLRRNTYKKSSYIPRHGIKIFRYDCANDRYQYENVVWITDAIGDGPEVKGGFNYPLDPNETKWRTTPGQVRIDIEGYPYWAMKPSSDPRYEEKSIDWKSITLGTYGASHIDYACKNF